jgi:hypothetical protein
MRGAPGGTEELQTAQLVIRGLHPLVEAFATGKSISAIESNIQNLNYLQCSWSRSAIYSNRRDFVFARRVLKESPQYKGVPQTSLVEKRVLAPDDIERAP